MGGIDVGFLRMGWVDACDTIGEVVEITEGVGLIDVGWTNWEEK